MPLYEYQCESCNSLIERIQKFSDPPLETCPSCGGRLKKLLSSPAIQFKGSGWYITDYAKKPSGDGAKAAKSDTAEKSDKPDKTEKTDKTDKTDKSDTAKSTSTSTAKSE